MRAWASVIGAAVRQRNCQQKTAIVRAGTLPGNAYYEELTQISLNQGTNANEQSVEEDLSLAEDDVKESENEIPQYESESDVEATSCNQMMKDTWTA